MLKTCTIVRQFAVVVSKHLFIQISEKVEWFDADIRPFDLALQKTPEVLQSVCVNLSVYVLFSVVDGSVHVVLIESPVGQERIGIDCTSSKDMIFNLRLNLILADTRNYFRANLAPTFENSENS